MPNCGPREPGHRRQCCLSYAVVGFIACAGLAVGQTTDIEQIFTGLRSDNEDVRQRSEQAFLYWGEFSVPAPIEVIDRARLTLARALRDTDSRIRGFATSTCVVLTIRADSGKALGPLTPLLLSGFSDPDP